MKKTALTSKVKLLYKGRGSYSHDGERGRLCTSTAAAGGSSFREKPARHQPTPNTKHERWGLHSQIWRVKLGMYFYILDCFASARTNNSEIHTPPRTNCAATQTRRELRFEGPAGERRRRGRGGRAQPYIFIPRAHTRKKLVAGRRATKTKKKEHKETIHSSFNHCTHHTGRAEGAT